ncbi:MAG: hypothetical protein IPF92_26835 [Myxococcales bacterium]|nr:hypothetical protein [Myxococcales bacterium]
MLTLSVARNRDTVPTRKSAGTQRVPGSPVSSGAAASGTEASSVVEALALGAGALATAGGGGEGGGGRGASAGSSRWQAPTTSSAQAAAKRRVRPIEAAPADGRGFSWWRAP